MAPKTPPGMTRQQVFRFVRGRLRQGLPPTVREVRDAFGFRSAQTAREHLENLVREGKLAKTPGAARGYRLPGPRGAGSAALAPILGKVQAGAPTTAVEEVEGYVPVDLGSEDELFALRVRGDSMTGAGILHGDLVIVRRQDDADHGDIVVALIDDEATVKRLWKKKGELELRPENPEFEPIVAGRKGIVIVGKVLEVRRYLGT